MARFVILFDEKEGTSPLVRLLDNIPGVSIVHQDGGLGWEPFDQHNCGPMSLEDLERCLDAIFSDEPADLRSLNAIYRITAKRALTFTPDAAVIGFKMRFVPPRPFPEGTSFLARVPAISRLLREKEQTKFRSIMFTLFARHAVKVLLAVRTDALRWGLSKYHGDGTGTPGHLQFKLAAGKISKEQLGKIHIDLQKLEAILKSVQASYEDKRRMMEDLTESGVSSFPLIYEEFQSDKMSYFRKLFGFLELPMQDKSIQSAIQKGAHFEKVHSDDISEFVSNPSEVLDRFGHRAPRWQ
jgi:hypothetical protein